MKALLLLLVACGPAAIPKPTGLSLPADVESWRPSIERLLELQAEQWQDPDWPRFLAEEVSIEVELESRPFMCGAVLAAGCTHWGYREFLVQLIGEDEVRKTAIGYELGHVYRWSHGLDDDDKYMGAFWNQARAAIDKWTNDPVNTATN